MERKRIQPLIGKTSEINEFTGVEGELTYDSDLKRLRYHDGQTKGGNRLANKSELDALSTANTNNFSLLNAEISNINTTLPKKINYTDVVDNLNSTGVGVPLSANQGRVLGLRDLGWGQSVKVVTSSRVIGSTYTNTTGKPIEVSITLQDGGDGTLASVSFYINGVLARYFGDLGSYDHEFSAIVPANATYLLTTGNILKHWAELS